jgi:hypothetical protein
MQNGSQENKMEADALPLEPQLQCILLWLFWRWGLENYLAKLAVNHDHPNLSLK